MAAALLHGIPSAEEFTEFLHCTAAFVQNWYSKREVERHTKSQSIGNMESVQQVILCESCVKHLAAKTNNL